MKVLSKDVMGSLNAASAAASRARQAEREKLKQDRREERKRIQDAVQAKDWRALPTPGERRRARKKLKRLARKSGVSMRAISPKPNGYKRPKCIPSPGAPHPNYKSDPDFYSSREWREVRYLALVKAQGRCQCCGARASDGATLHVDHVIPRYKAPQLALDPSNLQVLCVDCNLGKGAWDATDWRPSP